MMRIPDKTLADLIAINADFASEPMEFATLAALRELQSLRAKLSDDAAELTMKEAWGQSFEHEMNGKTK